MLFFKCQWLNKSNPVYKGKGQNMDTNMLYYKIYECDVKSYDYIEWAGAQ
jgi:hypothetical protein